MCPVQESRNTTRQTMERCLTEIKSTVTSMLGVSKIRVVADRHLQFNVAPEAGHRLSAFLTFMKVCVSFDPMYTYQANQGL